MTKQPTLFPLPAKSIRLQLSEAAERKSPEELKEDQRRYRYQKALKGIFPVNGVTREVDITPYLSFDEIPVGPRYYVGQLMKMGYNIQFGLPMSAP